MDSRIKNLKSTTFCGTRLTRRIADIQKTVEVFPALSRHELAATLCSHPGWFTAEGSGSAGVLSADAGAAGGPRHRVAAGEAAGIENGNRRSETAAYEPLGSGFHHSVRAEGADAAGTGGCDGEGGR